MGCGYNCRMGLPLLKEFLPEDPLAEQRARQLQLAMEEFVSALRDSFGQLAEEDVEYAFRQVAELESRQQAQFDRSAKGESQIQFHEAVLTTYQWGKDQLESLRDAVLVREARELSARAFWGAGYNVEQPEDSSYDELLRELAFARMIERGLADSDAGRTLSSEEVEERIASWRG